MPFILPAICPFASRQRVVRGSCRSGHRHRQTGTRAGCRREEEGQIIFTRPRLLFNVIMKMAKDTVARTDEVVSADLSASAAPPARECSFCSVAFKSEHVS